MLRVHTCASSTDKNNKLLAELIGSLDIAKNTEPLLKAWILLRILDLIDDRDNDWSMASSVKENTGDIFFDFIF